MVHLFHSDFPQGLLMSVELLHRSWKEKCRCITLIKDVLIARSSFISCYLKWSYFCLKIYWSKGRSPDVNQQWWYDFRMRISNIINIQTIYNAFNQYNQKYLSGHPLWLTFWRWWPLLVQVKAQGNNECVLIFFEVTQVLYGGNLKLCNWAFLTPGLRISYQALSEILGSLCGYLGTQSLISIPMHWCEYQQL